MTTHEGESIHNIIIGGCAAHGTDMMYFAECRCGYRTGCHRTIELATAASKLHNTDPRIPPVDPASPPTRLLRAIYGLCGECAHDDASGGENRRHYATDPDDGQHHCTMCGD
jgi:hypothetical protein